jgi:hypothetical protein
MNSKQCKSLAAVLALAVIAALALPAGAQQTPEVKEKPRMYTYVALWQFPRAQWNDWAKNEDADQKILKDAMASGALVGYGDDVNLVHQPDQPTHDDWFQSMSMAGLMNTLDQFYKSGSTQSPLELAATKHWDAIYVSRYYNWHGGSWQGTYSYGSSYKLKPDAPENAIDTLATSAIVPVMEKMLANGTIHEYEIDTEAIHTDAPGTFWIFYIGANADALDKVSQAIRDAVKGNQLIGPAFDSMVDFKEHRDYLARTNATYK